jgi:transcriptional regulator with XRE-family HTH domain
MRRAGHTQTEVATKLGVTQTIVSRLTTGSRPPSLALATRIQQLTGIPPEDWVAEAEANDDMDSKVAPV